MSNNNILDNSGVTVPASLSTVENKYARAGVGGASRISAHGNLLAVGDTTYSSYAGSVLIYDTSTGGNTPIATIYNPNPANFDLFGSYVEMYGDYLAVSVPTDDPSGTSSGALFLYDISTPSSPSLMTTLNGTFANQGMGGNGPRFMMTSSSVLLLVFSNNRTSTSDNTGQTFVYKMSDVQTNHTSTSLGTPLQTFAETDFTSSNGLIRCTNDYMIQVVTDQPGTVYTYRQYLRLRKFNTTTEQFEQFQDLMNYHEADCSYTGKHPNVTQDSQSQFCLSQVPGVDMSSDGTILGIGLHNYRDPSHTDGNAREGAFARYVLDTNTNQFVYNSITTWSDILSSGHINDAPADTEYVHFGKGGVEYIDDGYFVVSQGNNSGGPNYGTNIVVFDEDGNVVGAENAGKAQNADYRASSIVQSGSTVYWNALPNTGSASHIIGTFSITPGGSRTITVNGDVQQGAFSPYAAGGYSTSFDGSTGFIEGPSTDLMGSGAFTVECWVNISSSGTGFTDAFLAQYQSNNNFIFGVKAGVVRVWMSGSEVLVGTTNIVGNGWHHIAWVRNSSNSCQVYIDGVAEGSAFTNTTDFSTNLENFEIGSWDNGNGSTLDGSITDLRVIKGSAIYTSDFTPPTERLTVTSETVLLACHLPYVGAVAYVTTPASLSTTEKFGATESASIYSHHDTSKLAYPSFGAFRNVSISPNGENLAIGAEQFRRPNGNVASSARGTTFVLDTSDLDNITSQQWDPIYEWGLNSGSTQLQYSWEYAGKGVGITDTHVATYHEIFASSTVNEAHLTTALSNHATTPWPIGYSNLHNWSWSPDISVAPLSNLTDVAFLATTGGYLRGNDKTAWAMGGNYVVTFDDAFGIADAGSYYNGMWVYDIADVSTGSERVRYTGNDFTGQSMSTYLESRYQDIIFPKYFIPRQLATSDYNHSHGDVDIAGDYIVRGIGNANSGNGRIEIYKISELETIISGNTQVSPHAVINGDGTNTPNRLGRVLKTDGNHIIASGYGSSPNANVMVYDMDGNLVHTINSSNFINISSDGVTAVDISSSYIGIASWRSTTGGSNAGEYVILDANDPTVALKTENGSGANERLGSALAIASDNTSFAVTSRLPYTNQSAAEGKGELYLYSPTLNAASSSVDPITLTTSGSVSTERDAPYDFLDYDAATHGGSTYFDGTGDYLVIPDGTSGELTGDFTVECWWYPEDKSSSGNGNGLFQFYPSGDIFNSTQSWPSLGINNSGVWKARDGSSPANTLTTQGAYNQWHHVAIVRSSDTVKTYLNGSEVDSFTNSNSNANADIVLGGYWGTNDVSLGYISDFRVVNGTAVYTADFTPPTAPLTAVTNTSLLLPFDDATIIDRTGSSVLSVVGDTAVATATPPYVGSSYFTFDGIEDRIIAEGADIILAGDFTIEAWIYPEGTGWIIAMPGSADNVGLRISGTDLTFVDGTQNLITSGISTSQWQHVAVSKSSGTTTMFIDGTAVGSSTTNNSPIGSGGDLYVGSDTGGNGDFTGSVTDVRITTTAEYTSAFTPPNGVWS